jgi:hypothetical protein
MEKKWELGVSEKGKGRKGTMGTSERESGNLDRSEGKSGRGLTKVGNWT